MQVAPLCSNHTHHQVHEPSPARPTIVARLHAWLTHILQPVILPSVDFYSQLGSLTFTAICNSYGRGYSLKEKIEEEEIMNGKWRETGAEENDPNNNFTAVCGVGLGIIRYLLTRRHKQ